MPSLLAAEYPTLAGAVLALILIFWPPKRAVVEVERRERLAELEGGAEERHLDERRTLETYGPNSAGPYRLWGFLLLALSIIPLFL
jgi:hypothetical protein